MMMTTVSGFYLGRDRTAPASPLRGHESKISGKAICEGRLHGLPPRPAVEAGGVAEGGARRAANVLYSKSGCRGTAEGAGGGFGKEARAGRVNGGGSSGAPGLRPRSRGRQRQWPEASKTPQPCAAQLRPANSHPP